MEGFFSYIQHQFKWLDRPNKWVCSNVWQVPTSMQLVLETDEVKAGSERHQTLRTCTAAPIQSLKRCNRWSNEVISFVTYLLLVYSFGHKKGTNK